MRNGLCVCVMVLALVFQGAACGQLSSKALSQLEAQKLIPDGYYHIKRNEGDFKYKHFVMHVKKNVCHQCPFSEFPERLFDDRKHNPLRLVEENGKILLKIPLTGTGSIPPMVTEFVKRGDEWIVMFWEESYGTIEDYRIEPPSFTGLMRAMNDVSPREEWVDQWMR